MTENVNTADTQVEALAVEVEIPVEAEVVEAPFCPEAEELTLDDAIAAKEAIVVDPVPVPEVAGNYDVIDVPSDQAAPGTLDDEILRQSDVLFTQPNVEEHFSTEVTNGAGSPDKLTLPAENSDVVMKSIDSMPDINVSGTRNQGLWASAVKQGLPYLPVDNAFTMRLADKEAGFSQTMQYNGTMVYATTPSRKKKPGTTEMEGEMALLQVVTHLGIGGLNYSPMYNSGFWVQFKPASETELLELTILLGSDKINLGRGSYGLTHSNHLVYTLDRVFSMALDHVYATSVKADEMPTSMIPKYLQPQDIHSFIWGFLCACYPNGFKYETACISDPEKCQHVFKGTIALNKLQVVDNKALSDKQKNHMLSRMTNSMALKDVQDYQKDISRMHDSRIIIGEGTPYEIALTIKTPSIPEYIEQGMRYIDSIVDSITRAMSADAGTEERSVNMRTASNASSLCQYIHFVKSIEIGEVSKPDGSVVKISDSDTILNTLKTLSSIDSIRGEIIEAILKYIGTSTLAIIAIPAYDCPACKKDQSEATEARFPRHKAYVPIDIFQVFFGLHAQRMNRIEKR